MKLHSYKADFSVTLLLRFSKPFEHYPVPTEKIKKELLFHSLAIIIDNNILSKRFM